MYQCFRQQPEFRTVAVDNHMATQCVYYQIDVPTQHGFFRNGYPANVTVVAGAKGCLCRVEQRVRKILQTVTACALRKRDQRACIAAKLIKARFEDGPTFVLGRQLGAGHDAHRLEQTVFGFGKNSLSVCRLYQQRYSSPFLRPQYCTEW